MECKHYALECKRGCTDKCFAENLYRPSNGSEGCGFTSCFCDNCIHENPDPESGKKCELLTSSMLYYPTEKGYPMEWNYDPEGNPRCTKFVKWDWGNDGDPNDPDNPNRPPDPPDPMQLNLFPLYVGDKNITAGRIDHDHRIPAEEAKA